MRIVFRNIYLNIFIVGFIENVEATLINKTDGENRKERKDYWRRIF